MTENNNIENLFKDALSNYEAPVDASLWQGIEQVASQPAAGVSVGTNAASVIKSFSVVKLFVAVAAVSVVGVVSYFVFNNNEDLKPSPKIETNTNVNSNAGSVSETVTQPTPEKIVVNETKPVSATKKQSSPDIFSNATNPTTENLKQEKTNTTTQSTTSDVKDNASKPEKTLLQPSDVVKAEEKYKQEPLAVKAEENKIRAVTADDPLLQNQEAKPLTFPGIDKQVFTPNGDGMNDIFEVDDSQMGSINVKIISTSGKTVYLRDKIGGGSWDGRLLSGDEAPEGLYIVFINGTGLDGKKYSRITKLQLKRN